MKRLILSILVMAILTMGCASTGTYVAPAECLDGTSVILEKFPDPRGLDKGLLSVQLIALDQIDGYTKEDAVAVLDQLRESLVGGITYADGIELITAQLSIGNSLAGGAIFIVGPDISVLASGIVISDCDMALIDKHIAKQKVLIQIYNEE
jgi:hypothetical protein